MVFGGHSSPGTEFYISTSRADIPKNAIQVGTNGGKDSYVGCCTVGEEFVPAHIIPGDRKMYFTGSSNYPPYSYAHTYLTLCPKYTLNWQSSWQDGKVPEHSVKLGGSATEDYYVGRTTVDGDYWVGKVVPSKGGLVHPVYEEEKFSTSYEVLTVVYDFTPGTSFYVAGKPGDVPDNAILAGATKEGHPVYVGAVYFTNFLSGKAVPANKLLYFVDSEDEKTTEQITYLTFDEGYSYQWMALSEGAVPANAAFIGQKVTEPFYVGRCKHEEDDCVGAVTGSPPSLSYGYDGKAQTTSTFEVLVVTRTIALSADVSLYYSTGPLDVPDNAIPVGPSSYVGYIKTSDEAAPALITVRDGKGWLSYGFNKKEYITFKLVFVVSNAEGGLTWARAADGEAPENAIKLGQDQNGEDYFVGKATMDGQACIGKICKAAGCCFMPKNGVEKTAKSYEVLVSKE